MLEPPVLLSPSEVVFDTVRVDRGPIELTVTGPASFVPVAYEDQYFAYKGGRLQNVYVRVGDTVQVGTLLADLYVGGLANQIALQRVSLAKARLQSERKLMMGASKLELELAALDVESETLRLRMYEQELDDSKLYATMKGDVVFVNSLLSPGSTIDAFQTLVRIADPTELQLRYSGRRVFDFQISTEVAVRVRDLELVGRVVESPNTVSSDAAEQQLRTALIQVDDLPDEVVSGDLAQVSLVLDRREEALIVPKDAVRAYLGRSYVYILENGSKKERTVETGIETPTLVEIVQGLNEGESVILR